MAEPSSFELTQDQQFYLDTFMNRVSRSFALVVPFVEKPLTYFLATSYLICRVADNIEDCTQTPAWQRERFAELETMLNEPASASAILSLWENEDWPGLTPDEERLMGAMEGLDLWRIYALIPQRDRAIIKHWVTVMITGMSRLEDPVSSPHFVHRNGVAVAVAEKDYDEYCYYVAGTVGNMATELVINHYQLDPDAAKRLMAYCEACGRGLQKTNILKDFPKDLKRHVSYLPDEWMREVNYSPLSLSDAPLAWKRKVIHNVLEELEDSVEYVLDLPYHTVGYRMASLLSLLSAYQTLLFAAKNNQALFTLDHYVKIPREIMAGCIQDARSMVADNAAVKRYCVDVTQAIEVALTRSEVFSAI